MPTPNSASQRRLPIQVLIALIIAGVILAISGAALPPDLVHNLFSETGPIERGSAVLWAILALFILIILRPITLPTIAGAIVALACAARESDLHKRFTDYSVLKPGFYFKAEYPLTHRLIAGVICAIVAAATIVLLLRMVQLVRQRHRPIPAWMQIAALGILTLIGSKVLDRAPALIEDLFGIVTPARLGAVVHAVEEGMESLLPIVFAMAVWAYATDRRHQQ